MQESRRGEIFVENATATPKLRRSGMEDIAPTELSLLSFNLQIFRSYGAEIRAKKVPNM